VCLARVGNCVVAVASVVFHVPPLRYYRLRVSECRRAGLRRPGRGTHVHHAATMDIGHSQPVGVRDARSGSWSGLMWSGSGAGIGLELSETFLKSPKWFRRDLRILCSSCHVNRRSVDSR
jgi:hypothetical protein